MLLTLRSLWEESGAPAAVVQTQGAASDWSLVRKRLRAQEEEEMEAVLAAMDI